MAAPDDEIIKRAVGGDHAALTELFRLHAPPVRRWVAPRIPRRWRSLFSANDVMQQTYADAFRGIGGFAGTQQSSFAAWLHRLARCNLRDAIRGLEAEKRTPKRHGTGGPFVTLWDELTGSGTTPSQHGMREEQKAALNRAIAQLSKIYRDVVRMCDLEGKSAREVAEALGRSPGAIYMLRARARDQLREILGSSSDFFLSA